MGIQEDIGLFEKYLNDLIVKYEHYFLGLEKREPLKLLEEVEKISRKHTGNNIVNTMHSFKYNSLKARLTSYKQYWSRITRLMEDGKYSRDRFKMDIQAKPPVPPVDGAKADKSEKHDQAELFYRQFLQARKECNLPVDNVTREIVNELVEKHKLAALAKYRCADVDLRITVEDGSPKLKIRPKK